MTAMNKRVELIDIAKGISIILVVFNHSDLANLYPGISNSLALIRMPFFIFLSGVFFSTSYSLKNHFIKKTDALLKPYFFTLGSVIAIHFMLDIIGLVASFTSSTMEPIDIFKQFYWNLLEVGKLILGALYGSGPGIVKGWLPLWFLTHLWIVFILSYLIVHHSKIERSTKILKLVLIFSLFSIGYIFMDYIANNPIIPSTNRPFFVGLPFSADIAFITTAFFLSGFFLKDKIVSFSPKLSILSITIISFILITNFTSAAINFNSREYRSPFFSTVAAFSGIYLALSLSYYLKYSVIIKNNLILCGSSSLFILIFHVFFMLTVSRSIISSENQSPEIMFLFLISSIVLSLLIKRIILNNPFLRACYLPIDSLIKPKKRNSKPLN